jgi:hypothetical protein
MGFIQKEHKIYATIHEGEICIPTLPTNPDAVMREWKAPDGSTGVKYEIRNKGVVGIIEKIEFNDGQYGEQMIITFKKEEGQKDNIILTMPSKSRFATELMAKLPNVDIAREISLSPFDFIDKNGKKVIGMVVWQLPADAKEGDKKEKVVNFFQNYDEANKKWNCLNGFPEVPKKKVMTKDHWTQYFLEVKMFLVEYTQENIIPKLGSMANDYETTDAIVSEEGEINVDAIPFK